jgi:uncharacterized protein (DUF427 family)
MVIPTEPIGGLRRVEYLFAALADVAAGNIDRATLEASFARAVQDTVRRLEDPGSLVVTDGERRKPSFATYPLDGFGPLEPDGAVIPATDGHTRQLPRLVGGSFRCGTFVAGYLAEAAPVAERPVEQAVIASSALSLLHPQNEIPGCSREPFLADNGETDIRQCLDACAAAVQLDFTEWRPAVRLDPSKGVLPDFVALNSTMLDQFSVEERARLGVHTCPGGDRVLRSVAEQSDSTNGFRRGDPIRSTRGWRHRTPFAARCWQRPAPGREVQRWPAGFPWRRRVWRLIMLRAVWNGVVLAEAPRTVRIEGNHYFPPESLNREYFSASGTKSLCPWKGLASYYTVTVDDAVNPDAAWYYPHPSPLARRIRNHVAFWNDVAVEGEAEARQAGSSAGWWRKLVGRGA